MRPDDMSYAYQGEEDYEQPYMDDFYGSDPYSYGMSSYGYGMNPYSYGMNPYGLGMSPYGRDDYQFPQYGYEGYPYRADRRRIPFFFGIGPFGFGGFPFFFGAPFFF